MTASATEAKPATMTQTAIAAMAPLIEADPKEKLTIKPTAEIIMINSLGQQIHDGCDHAVIPGLDAHFCQTCQVWWVDQQMRDSLLSRKRNSGEVE